MPDRGYLPSRVYQNLREIERDLYAMQSYFKNHVGFNRESNLIDKIRHELNIKEDKKVNAVLCKRCGHAKSPDNEYCFSCTLELTVYGEEDGSDA